MRQGMDKSGEPVLRPVVMVRGGLSLGEEGEEDALGTHLLVVPVTFLPVLRAEHTTTTRLFST